MAGTPVTSSRWPSVPPSFSSSAPEGTITGAQVDEAASVAPSGVIPNFFHTRLWGAQSEGAVKPARPSEEAVMAAVRAITHGAPPVSAGTVQSEIAKSKAQGISPDAESEADVNVGPKTPPRANSRQQQSTTTPASMEKTIAPTQPPVKKRPATPVPEQDLRQEAKTAKPRTHPAETPSKRPRSAASTAAMKATASAAETKPVAVVPLPQPVVASKAKKHETAIVEWSGSSKKRPQVEHVVLSSHAPLEKVRPSAKKKLDLRGLALTQVPAQAFEGDQNGLIGGKWPRRLRMKPLDTWRNERIVYERKPGSPTPSIKAVVLNCSPRPQNAGGRSMQVKMLSLATPLDDAPSEVIGPSTQHSHSKVITLPPWNRNKTKRPFVQVLDASGSEGARHTTGVLKVLEGTVRMTVERPDIDEYEEADLGLHSTVVLPSCGKLKILVTATSEFGSRVWWNVNSEPRVRPLALPNGRAESGE